MDRSWLLGGDQLDMVARQSRLAELLAAGQGGGAAVTR
jgi:hypothetical protein